MTENRHFSDDELTAYLDGETAHAPVAEIEQALKEDGALRARLDTLAIDKPAFDAAIDGVLSGAPKPPSFLQEATEKDAPKPSGARAGIAAAAAIALVIGMGAGLLVPQKPLAGWHEYVAAYHALYTTETLGNIEREDAVIEAELDRVGAALGTKISVKALRKSENLTYKRAQILAYNGKPLLQMAFLSKSGDPVALCVMRAIDNVPDGPEVDTMEGLEAAVWSRGGFDFILIGSRDRKLIESEAKAFAARL